MSLPTPDALQVVLTITTIAAFWFGWVKYVGPRIRRGWNWLADLLAVFMGRPGHYDRVSGKEVPRVPSLVDALVQIRDKQDEQGVAVTTAIDNLTAVVTQVADQQITLGEHTRQLADLRLAQAVHTEQIGLLKIAAAERTAMHQESAAVFDMVAKRDSDVIDPPDEKEMP